MRHRRRVKHFSRKQGARKALIRGLVESLVEHGRIKTTVDKAKEARRHVERAITLGKKGTVAARRLILARYPQVEIMNTIVNDLSVRFKERNGGYTRIIKLGKRPGDMAEMAFIEFVDFDFAGKSAEVAKAPAQKKESAGKVKKAVYRTERKVRNKIQTKSRRENRA
jgi:large subunit ribosomal protein L17